jgi:hypothetical protein
MTSSRNSSLPIVCTWVRSQSYACRDAAIIPVGPLETYEAWPKASDALEEFLEIAQAKNAPTPDHVPELAFVSLEDRPEDVAREEDIRSRAVFCGQPVHELAVEFVRKFGFLGLCRHLDVVEAPPTLFFPNLCERWERDRKFISEAIDKTEPNRTLAEYLKKRLAGPPPINGYLGWGDPLFWYFYSEPAGEIAAASLKLAALLRPDRDTSADDVMEAELLLKMGLGHMTLDVLPLPESRSALSARKSRSRPPQFTLGIRAETLYAVITLAAAESASRNHLGVCANEKCRKVFVSKRPARYCKRSCKDAVHMRAYRARQRRKLGSKSASPRRKSRRRLRQAEGFRG